MKMKIKKHLTDMQACQLIRLLYESSLFETLVHCLN